MPGARLDPSPLPGMAPRASGHAPTARPAKPKPPAGPRKPAKARHAAECETLEQLPNIGPSMAEDLRSIGIATPAALREADGFALYRRLCEATGTRQDPCVLDTFLAITDFMRGAPAAPWWRYTAQRKLRYGEV
jgi:hypothetical protein